MTERQSGASEDFAFVLEMTPSAPEETADRSEEFILTPSPSDEKPVCGDLILETEIGAGLEEITFEGEEEAAERVEEAMAAYDKAMDQAAGII